MAYLLLRISENFIENPRNIWHVNFKNRFEFHENHDISEMIIFSANHPDLCDESYVIYPNE